jgi:hypothetical protein
MCTVTVIPQERGVRVLCNRDERRMRPLALPLFYAPVSLWVLWLAIRHRGMSTITASSPGIPDGGVVGESKFRILSTLPSDGALSAGGGQV